MYVIDFLYNVHVLYFKTYQVLFKLNMFQKCLCSTKLTSLTTKAFSITAVKPLSWSDESRDGSWNTYTVTTSIAVGERNQDLLKILILFLLLIIHSLMMQSSYPLEINCCSSQKIIDFVLQCSLCHITINPLLTKCAKMNLVNIQRS